jgi:hypothetical protein
LSEVFTHFSVIDSFTGNLIDKTKLGEKVYSVNGRLDRELHIAFGDKYLIRGVIRYKSKLLNELRKKSPYFTKAQLKLAIRNTGVDIMKLPFKIP